MSETSQSNSTIKDHIVLELDEVSIHYTQPSQHSKAILYTNGLRKVNQHDLAGKTDNIYPTIELYFLLPSYWDVKKKHQQWPLSVLERMILARNEKGVWFGPGDTLTAHSRKINDTADPEPINDIFKQNHFFLMEPMAAEPLLENRVKGDCQWLGVTPIFQKEFDYKTRRSSLELMMNFEKNQVTELVDEHRPMAVKKRLFGLFY
jgi:hypothetical protein